MTNTTQQKCFVAYYRVSTKDQGESGLGLDAQRKAVAEHAGETGICKHYTEVESGRKNSRPELAKAIRYAERKNCVLIIAKLDRLSRNAAFLNQVLDSGVEVCACDMPYANRMTMGIMCQVAQHEVEMISQRTKEALQAAKARGQKLGSHNERWQKAMAGRVGFKLGTAEAGKWARQRAALFHAETMRGDLQALWNDGLSLREMADRLTTQDDHHPRRGDTWSATQVARVLDRLQIRKAA